MAENGNAKNPFSNSTNTVVPSLSRGSWVEWLGFISALLLVTTVCSVPLNYEQQLLFAVFSTTLALIIRFNSNDNYFRVIVLVVISSVTTGRYIYWRLTESLVFDNNIDFTAFDYLFAYGLVAAEMYAWTIMFLGYFQTIWPLKREVLPLPDDESEWPTVDVFIPTYNEPMNVVAPTILAAKNIDWPKDKLNVYVLDDGCRDEYRLFSERAGVHYIERKESTHAKAGNINRALGMCQGDFVAIFDCDHVPVRSFLKKTMGWFLRDSKLGLMQTPHLFFSPDPLERNLGIFRRVPNEGQLFYGLIQDGNDTWNSTFFCGSCAVLRRAALEEVGGIAHETVTEDAHTSLRMHRKGWNSAYLNIPQAAGLATDRLSGHVGQRIRWARGMVQILRIDNPLFGRGLKLSQRLNYFNAMSYFLYSLPRLIFLTAPLAFLFFEAHVFQAAAAMIAVYALPHVIQSHIANSAVQGRFRHGFWSEVYETILAAHILLPTLAALVNPKWGSFNVTDKGSKIESDQFEWRIALPYFIVLLMNLAGFAVGVGHLIWWNVYETSTVIMNLIWTSYNLIILGAALAVAWEKQQHRENVRIPRRERAVLSLDNGVKVPAFTSDLSLSGATLMLSQQAHLESGMSVSLEIHDGIEARCFQGKISTMREGHVGIQFEVMEPEQMSQLVHITHGREDAWVDWYSHCEPDHLLNSFSQVIRYGLLGLGRSLFGFTSTPKWVNSRGYALTSWAFVLVVFVLVSVFAPHKAQADSMESDTERSASVFRSASFKELGVEKPLRLHIGESSRGVPFSVRSNQLVTSARIDVKYSILPQESSNASHLEVIVNDTTVGEIPIEASTSGYQANRSITVDPLLIGEYNNLSVQVVSSDSNDCAKVNFDTPAVIIGNNSELSFAVRKLQLVNDLEMFPVPFFDARDHSELVLPFVLDSHAAESLALLKSAGILASWFGALADYRGAQFPVSIDALPEGNAIVLATPNHYPKSVDLPPISGPSLKLVNHPDNPYAKLLLVLGQNETELLDMVKALAFGQVKLRGDSVLFDNKLKPLAPRNPYDAPRWISTKREIRFAELSDPQNLTVNSNSPHTIKVNFRVPPDLFIWRSHGIPVKLGYRFANLSFDNASSLNISVNETPIRRISLNSQFTPPSDNQRYLGSFMNGGDAAEVTQKQIAQHRYFSIPFREMSGLNQLQFYYDFTQQAHQGADCGSSHAADIQSSIDADSTIDLSKFLHYARMPDLAMFANMGFPFTRYADLSETVIVIPKAANASEIQMLLDVFGKFGRATGYPSIRVTLLRAEQINTIQDKDILLIGTTADQPLLSAWQMYLPAVYSVQEQSWRRRNLSTSEKLRLWWDNTQDSHDFTVADRAIESSGQEFVSIMGTKSPLDAKRSLVALVTSSPYIFSSITDVLNDAERVRRVQGDLVVIDNGRVAAFRVTPNYFIGELPAWTKIRWYLSQHLIALAMVFVIGVYIGAVFVQRIVKRRAEMRLKFNA